MDFLRLSGTTRSLLKIILTTLALFFVWAASGQAETGCLVTGPVNAGIKMGNASQKLPFYAQEGCGQIKVTKGHVSVIFRNRQGQVETIKAGPKDDVREMVEQSEDTGFLKHAFAILLGRETEVVHYGGERLSDKAVFPGLPHDDLYVSPQGLLISEDQYYIESGGNTITRTDFTIKTLTLINLDTDKSITRHPNAQGVIYINASELENGTEYAWLIHVDSHPVKGRFFTVDEETQEEIGQSAALLAKSADPKRDKQTYDILLAGLLDDMGCIYQSRHLLKQNKKGSEQ